MGAAAGKNKQQQASQQPVGGATFNSHNLPTLTLSAGALSYGGHDNVVVVEGCRGDSLKSNGAETQATSEAAVEAKGRKWSSLAFGKESETVEMGHRLKRLM